MKAVIGILAAIGIVGCGGTAAPIAEPSGTAIASAIPSTPGASARPTPEATPTEAPTPSEEPTPEPTATPEPTPSPTRTPTPTPAPSADARKGDVFMYVDEDFGYVTGQIILEVENAGTTWIEILDFQSNYTVFDADGAITETGDFTVAVPSLVAPGDTAYLLGEVFSDTSRLRDYATVEADGYYEEADEPDVMLAIENSRVRPGQFGGGVEVVGQVVNPGSSRIDNAYVGAVFLDDAEDPIGIAWTFAENIEPGGKRAFTADSDHPQGTGPIADTLLFAEDAGF